MNSSRRKFIIAAAAAGVTAPLAWHFRSAFNTPEDHEFYSSYGDWKSVTIGEVDPAAPAYVVFFRPRSLRMSHFAVPLRVHSGVQDPARKNFLVFIAKWGQTICAFDRNTGEVLKTMACAPNRRFFGHGVWDAKENAFWVTENDDAKNEGRLVLRNHDLEIVREIPSHGTYPHEIKMPEPGILQVCNTGDFKTRHGLMAWIRAEDGKLLKSVEFKNELKTAGPSHFLHAQETLFIGGITDTDERPSAVWRMHKDAPPTRIEAADPTLFKGEVVSWAESPATGLVMWTQAKTEAVFSVSAATDEKARVQMPLYPHGMISDGDRVWVTRKSKLISWENGRYNEVARGPSIGRARFGSHIIRIDT